MHARCTCVDMRGLFDIPVEPKNRSYILGMLYHCIRSRRNDEAKSILNEVPIDNSFNLLHYAAKFNNHEIARALIKLGTDVNHRGQFGQTPLAFAIKKRGTETVKLLLETGARIDITDDKGQNALQMAFALGRERVHPLFLEKLQATSITIDELVDKLIIGGCNLYHAAYANDFRIVERMIGRGVNVDSRNYLGRTALHAALELNDVRLAKWLIDNGADVNARDDHGSSALLFTVVPVKKAALQLLLEHGADPNVESDCNKETALYAFATHTQDSEDVIECMELLMHYDADPRNATDRYWNVLEYALYTKNYKRMYHLIAQVAMLEKLGTAVDKSVLKFDITESHAEFSKLMGYRENCEQLLGTNVFQKLSLLDLLTDSDIKMKKYVRHEEFLPTIKEVSSKIELDNSCPYYHSRLMYRISKATERLKLENYAIPLICDFFDRNENECYIAAKKIVVYLNKRDLQNLNKV